MYYKSGLHIENPFWCYRVFALTEPIYKKIRQYLSNLLKLERPLENKKWAWVYPYNCQFSVHKEAQHQTWVL
jgi:hypothetical protein